MRNPNPNPGAPTFSFYTSTHLTIFSQSSSLNLTNPPLPPSSSLYDRFIHPLNDQPDIQYPWLRGRKEWKPWIRPAQRCGMLEPVKEEKSCNSGGYFRKVIIGNTFCTWRDSDPELGHYNLAKMIGKTLFVLTLIAQQWRGMHQVSFLT